MLIENSRIVVTGASSGIGCALAIALAESGGRLVLVSRRKDELNRVAEEIERRGATVRPAVSVCDVSSVRSVRRMMREAVDVLGGVDILINNAGISLYGDTLRTSTEHFLELLAVNLLGPFHIIQEVLPHMQRQRSGLVVNVSSVAGIHGIPYLGAYGATKAGLIALSQSLRAELAGSGVSVMLVYPGYTETNLFRREVHLGGASRPGGPYSSADQLARRIVRAVRRGQLEVDPMAGRVMRLLDALSPQSTDGILARMAERLKSGAEECHA